MKTWGCKEQMFVLRKIPGRGPKSSKFELVARNCPFAKYKWYGNTGLFLSPSLVSDDGAT